MNSDGTNDAEAVTNSARAPWLAHQRRGQWQWPAPDPRARAFHQALPGYAPTPLRSLPSLAVELGVAHVLAKDESFRLGLPAFKALGASWAMHCALESASQSTPVTFVTATDGNHGRAVARFAQVLGHQARIVVPGGVHPAAVAAIRAEGAEVVERAGSYDDAVAYAAELADGMPEGILVQDTAWEGYEELPRRIVEGYATLFAEIDDQARSADVGNVDAVFVPAGVGSLLQAALTHYRGRDRGPAVVCVEPVVADCVWASLAAGHPVTVPGGQTIMAGLNCGTPSFQAWPLIQAGVNAAVLVSDEEDVQAARDLAALGVSAGPCGAAGLAAARVALRDPVRRAHLGVTGESVIALLITEGSDANPLPIAPLTAADLNTGGRE